MRKRGFTLHGDEFQRALKEGYFRVSFQTDDKWYAEFIGIGGATTIIEKDDGPKYHTANAAAEACASFEGTLS